MPSPRNWFVIIKNKEDGTLYDYLGPYTDDLIDKALKTVTEEYLTYEVKKGFWYHINKADVV